MDYLMHIVWGFVMAYVGLLPPGMLNMTTVKTSIDKGKSEAYKFAAGAASIVIIQAFIALYFANYLNEHPEIIDKLKYAGIAVFFILAVFFFIQARKKFKGEGSQKSGSPFYLGMFMSSINAMAIPFYLVYSTIFQKKGLILLELPYIYFFVGGAVIGAFLLFVTYAIFADIISKKAQFLAQNINYVLSGIFVLLGILTLVQVIS